MRLNTTAALPVDRLGELFLAHGAHTARGKELCAMEAVAWLAGEKHSDAPPCASPVIAAFLRRWNDDLDDTGRQILKPFLPRIVGTASTPEVEEIRAWMATDWMVRVHTPAWLRLAGLVAQAEAVERLERITNSASADASRAALGVAKKDAAAAWVAAGDAAWVAAWVAAGAAARAAAGDAAWAAAGAAARAAAGDAAWDAAWVAAGAAAWAAARDAAGAAAGAAVKPTVVSLQASAFDLLDRMIRAGDAA